MANKGNPYKKNNGRFASASDYDILLYEPNKEKDIARNKEEADARNKVIQSSIVTGDAKIVNPEEFDKVSKGNKVYYRRAPDPLKDSSVKGIGHQAHGEGLYFAEDKTVTDNYGGDNSKVLRAFLSKNAKVISELDAHNLYIKETGKKPQTGKEVTAYLKKNGYDAMVAEKAYRRKSDYLIVFNRDILTASYIKEDK